MTDDRSFERVARSWLESGPTEAPERVVEAALQDIETTTQERDWHVPRRAIEMSILPRIGAVAAVLAVAVVAGVLILRPGPTGNVGGSTTLPSNAPPSLSPTAVTSTVPASPSVEPSTSAAITPAMLTQAFTSSRHGYSIRVPASWTATPARDRWSGSDGPDPGAGNMDTLSGPGYRLVIESAPLGRQTPDAWRAAYAARNGLDGVGVCDVLPKDQPRIQIGSVSGYLDGDDCPGDSAVVAGDRFFEALAFTGGRVYLFWIQGTVDRPSFEAVLSTVQFDPAAANDKP